MVKDPILVGQFGAPQGIEGGVRLYSFTSDPSAIASYKPLLDESGRREFSILRLRALKDNILVARIAGVCGRASAGALTNIKLFVPRSSLPDAGAGEYYLADLIGLAAVTGAGENFGRVVNVWNFGGGDILEVARQSGGETLLFPFKRDIVPNVDLKGGELTVLPPIEIEAEPSRPER
ncbi:MAG: ribosome maturation factor RimM [Beijerinckiaceae bacterium]|nr:ribosome maturation factor RimM [Beijerinckiaceae bacterium]MCI0735832.1 ribosome maturation factor RimM [Beijerinckiaceae bacterium]